MTNHFITRYQIVYIAYGEKHEAQYMHLENAVQTIKTVADRYHGDIKILESMQLWRTRYASEDNLKKHISFDSYPLWSYCFDGLERLDAMEVIE